MRIEKLQQVLSKKNIDLALFFSLDEKPNTNIIYYSGYSGIGILAVPKNKPAFLVVPDMEYEKGTKTKLKVYKTEKKKRLMEMLVNLLKGLEINSAGIEEDRCSVYLYKMLRKAMKVRFKDISLDCDLIRMIKDETEISYLKKACDVTDKIYSSICKRFRFTTEKEIKEFMLEEFSKNDSEAAFPPIVASSNNSSEPHYSENGKLKPGFLLLDFGAKYKGYCADMTRMLYLGKPGKKEIEDYNLVLKTILDCEESVPRTKRFRQVYSLSLYVLGDKSEFFIHGLGHGVGLDIHEVPSLTAEGKQKIVENVAFTIEPGIYFPGKYGIRIEDTILMKKDKIEILTKSDKSLKILKGIN